MSPNPDAVTLDSKTRRKLEDQRRMAFRRAIEDYTEERRLQRELDAYPDLIPLLHAERSPLSAPRAA